MVDDDALSFDFTNRKGQTVIDEANSDDEKQGSSDKKKMSILERSQRLVKKIFTSDSKSSGKEEKKIPVNSMPNQESAFVSHGQDSSYLTKSGRTNAQN